MSSSGSVVFDDDHRHLRSLHDTNANFGARESNRVGEELAERWPEKADVYLHTGRSRTSTSTDTLLRPTTPTVFSTQERTNSATSTVDLGLDRRALELGGHREKVSDAKQARDAPTRHGDEHCGITARSNHDLELVERAGEHPGRSANLVRDAAQEGRPKIGLDRGRPPLLESSPSRASGCIAHRRGLGRVFFELLETSIQSASIDSKHLCSAGLVAAHQRKHAQDVAAFEFLHRDDLGGVIGRDDEALRAVRRESSREGLRR